MSIDKTASRMWKVGFWSSIVVLVAIQQYPGLWGSESLILGFLPVPLFYQVIVSLLAVAVWWVGTIVAWPVDDDPGAVESQSLSDMAPSEDKS